MGGCGGASAPAQQIPPLHGHRRLPHMCTSRAPDFRSVVSFRSPHPPAPGPGVLVLPATGAGSEPALALWEQPWLAGCWRVCGRPGSESPAADASLALAKAPSGEALRGANPGRKWGGQCGFSCEGAPAETHLQSQGCLVAHAQHVPDVIIQGQVRIAAGRAQKPQSDFNDGQSFTDLAVGQQLPADGADG